MVASTDDELPGPVRDRLQRWLDTFDDVAPGVIEGLYVVGSTALGDWRPGSDVDIVAVLAEPADDATAERLQRAHDHDRADAAGGPPVDGPFVAWGDLSIPPGPLHRPWTLDGEFHHDAECFEINPIVWYVLATSGVAVRGPLVSELDVYVDRHDRMSWVRENVDSYWRSVLSQLRNAVDRLEPDDRLPGTIAQWCLLGVCRMLVTASTGDVESKRSAGERVAAEFPEHAAAINHCLALRGTESTISRDEARAVADAMAAVLDTIT